MSVSGPNRCPIVTSTCRRGGAPYIALDLLQGINDNSRPPLQNDLAPCAEDCVQYRVREIITCFKDRRVGVADGFMRSAPEMPRLALAHGNIH